MRWRSWICACLIGLCCLPASTANALTLSLEESRALAQDALLQGAPEVTLEIAQALIRVNPRDAHALLLISAANRALGQNGTARKAAALAYKISERHPQRLQAAQLAAQSALAENRPTLSQIWLRRAALHTASEQEAETIARAYSRLRQINPWTFRLGLSLRPSSNVNNGADSALQIIDGVPVVGQLSGTAQALSGVIGTTTLSLGYRLSATQRRQTKLNLNAQIQRVSLSNDAKSLAPDARNRDFGYTYAELSLDHMFAVGQRKGDRVDLGFTLGGLWNYEDTEYSFARLDAERIWRPEDGSRLSLGASVTGYNRATDREDSTRIGLRGSYARPLSNGDTIGVTLAYDTSLSDSVNRVSESVNLRLRYDFSKSWGPAKASAALTLSHADYPDYEDIVPVPGGRQDLGAYADLSLFFADYDYAGFAPKVTLRAGRKTSNVSRFDTREISVIVGIQSKF